MLQLYKKLYATLAGRVDTVTSELEDIASSEFFDRQRLLTAIDALRRALQEAEDLYLDAPETDPE